MEFCFQLICTIFLAGVLTRFYFAFKPAPKTLGLFHPYCNDGGGGERVLWLLVQSLQTHQKAHQFEIIVYSGDVDFSGEEILKKAEDRFGIRLAPVRFVPLYTRTLVEKKWYPRFTMIGQSLGSMVVGMEALLRHRPDVFVDTMGYSFTFPIFRFLGGCAVGCYVHYPTISTDMLSKVASARADFNNDQSIAQSPFKTSLKILYYKIFALLYKLMGSCASLVMVNSSWTHSHIKSIWNPTEVLTIYPPVDCQGLKRLPLGPREPMVVSVGQFRKEKDHGLQLAAFNLLLKKSTIPNKKQIQLVMIGATRKHVPGDEKRVQKLKQRAKDLGLEDQVQFVVNATKAELQSWLGRALVGIHTMKDEHFGISVVELMAAGVIPIAHNSAGPKEDIILDPTTGFLATTAEEYASHMEFIFSHPEEANHLQLATRASVDRFSDEQFSKSILRALKKLPLLATLLSP